MKSSAIYKDAVDANLKLSEFGITKQELIRVPLAAIAAYNESVSIDPISAKGLLMYIHGTRAIREVLLPKGWQVDRTDNIESTYHPELGVKIIYQNSNTAAISSQDPQAICNKGPAARRIVELSQGCLFKEWEEERIINLKKETSKANAQIWFLCVHVNGDNVYAELSCPESIEDGKFSGFSERIFILGPGEFESLDLDKMNDDLEDQDFDINITKK